VPKRDGARDGSETEGARQKEHATRFNGGSKSGGRKIRRRAEDQEGLREARPKRKRTTRTRKAVH